MKALMTNQSEHCKHTRIICEDCGSFVFQEKPGPKGISKKFIAKMKRAIKVMNKETDRLEQENERIA